MAGTLKNGNPDHDLTTEELRRGGINSGIARRKKKTMLETLEKILDEKNKKSGKTYRELATLGLIEGAVNGNPNNYRLMLELLGELMQKEEDKKEKELSKVEELLTKIEQEANK